MMTALTDNAPGRHLEAAVTCIGWDHPEATFVSTLQNPLVATPQAPSFVRA